MLNQIILNRRNSPASTLPVCAAASSLEEFAEQVAAELLLASSSRYPE